MNIEAKVLLDFVRKVTVDGSIPEFALVGEGGDVVSRVKTTDNIGMVMGVLKNVDIPEPIGINNAKKFIETLKRFTGKINVELNEKKNAVVICGEDKDMKRVTVRPIAALENINNYLEEVPPLFEKFNDGTIVQTRLIKDALKGKNISDDDKVCVEFKDGTLIISVGDSDTNKCTDVIPNIAYKDGKAYYPVLFDEMIAVIGDIVRMSLHDEVSVNGPIKMTEDCDDYKIEYIVAPRIVEGFTDE